MLHNESSPGRAPAHQVGLKDKSKGVLAGINNMQVEA